MNKNIVLEEVYAVKSKIKDDKKIKGRVYTPNYMVKNVLDMVKYDSRDILKKHVIDNSCGDGAFLCEIVSRYYNLAKQEGYKNGEIVRQLEEYIHGIEIEKEEEEEKNSQDDDGVCAACHIIVSTSSIQTFVAGQIS